MKKRIIILVILLSFITLALILVSNNKKDNDIQHEISIERAADTSVPSLYLSYGVNEVISFALYYDKSNFSDTDTLTILKNISKNLIDIPAIILEKNNTECEVNLNFNYDIDERIDIYYIPTEVLVNSELTDELIVKYINTVTCEDDELIIFPNYLYLVVTNIDNSINHIFTFKTNQ